jgi:DNA-binding Lrp family transcriptional regulator
MRPVTDKRNALRYPLEHILGSEAHVRLLRVLAHEVGAPLGVNDAAKLAGLTPQGARKALERLVETGIVERVGGGRTRQYGMRQEEPIVRSLTLLFADERERYEEVVSGLTKAVVGLHEALEAWVEKLPDRAGDPMEIVVVAETNAVSWIGQELRSRLVGLEKAFDLIIEVVVYTRADAPRPGPDALFLWSAEPEDIPVVRELTMTHREAEERSLRMARAVSELIRSDPSLIKRATQHLDRLAREGQGTAAGDITEWRQLLETYSPERLRTLLVSASSRAERLRQSSPFFAVLTADERERLMALMERPR